MSWTRILATHPKTIKKKMDWYEKQKPQKELSDFLKEDEEECKKKE